MKGFYFYLIIALTLLNLVLFGISRVGSNQISRDEVNSRSATSLENIKDALFLRSLIDENKTINLKEKPAFPILVFRFSFKNCSECIFSALNELNKFKQEYKINNILLVGTFASDKDFKVFERTHRKKINGMTLRNVNDHFYGLQIEEDATDPFFFIHSQNNSIQHIFIPLKEDIVRTQRYFLVINQKYFAVGRIDLNRKTRFFRE